MFQKWEDFETLAFVLLAIFFQWRESRSPARQIDKKAGLKLDLIGVCVLSGSLMIFRPGIRALFEHLLPAVSDLRAMPSALKIAVGFVLTDFILYWIHRFMHTVEPMWRTHVWHHTSEQLYWLSGARTSVIHGFLYTIPQVFFPFILFKFTLTEAAIAFSIGVFVQLWEHSNLDLDLGVITWLFVGPVYHRVHHAVDRKIHDSNYGTLLTIWDRAFGTYTDPKSLPADFKIGVGRSFKPLETETLRMVVGL